MRQSQARFKHWDLALNVVEFHEKKLLIALTEYTTYQALQLFSESLTHH